MIRKKLIKWEPKKELILVVVLLFWLWFAYFSSENLYKNNVIYTIIISLLLTVLIVCVGIPVWWIAVYKKEGLSGLGITSKRMGVTILFSLILTVWRLMELKEYFGEETIFTTILFNGLAIWEVVFIYGFLQTRYEHSFGKIPSILLTTISVGIYHIGTLTIDHIIQLCLVVCVCAICFSITQNIFTLWPMYWMVGCSASTLKSGMKFPIEMVYLSAMILAIQVLWILIMANKYKRMCK